MRRRHFETLRPLCPACRIVDPDRESPLLLIDDGGGKEDIFEGVLHCSRDDCRHEYPIIDGIPLLVPQLRSYVAENIFPIYCRDDLNAVSESILGDCCGQGSLLDNIRQHLSSFTWDHYGDLDSEEPAGDPSPGAVRRLLERSLQLCSSVPQGPILDVGCSVGRGSLELAAWSDELVLGVDLHFPMLRTAAEVLRYGRVRYPRRRIGVAYDRREFPVEFSHRENVDFWACDATALPFADQTFSLAVGLNVLDCVPSPVELLSSLARLLSDRGELLLTCPYDWSAAVTAIESWIGGHSQRGSDDGSPVALLRALLTPGTHPMSIENMRFLGELDDLPWQTRNHERSVVQYRVHAVAARKQVE